MVVTLTVHIMPAEGLPNERAVGFQFLQRVVMADIVRLQAPVISSYWASSDKATNGQ